MLLEWLQRPFTPLFLMAFTAASATSSEPLEPVISLGVRKASGAHQTPALLSLQSSSTSPLDLGIPSLPALQEFAHWHPLLNQVFPDTLPWLGMELSRGGGMPR